MCMGWVWKLPNSFLVRVELRRALRLLYMCWERSGYNLNKENFPIVDHTHYPDLRTDFWVRNKGNLDVRPFGKL